MGWRGAEAWIFLSIGDSAEAGQLAGLDTVISQADSNRHLVPMVAEFQQAISQLLGARLVNVTEEKFGLTTFGQRLYDSINSVRRGNIVRYLATEKEWRVNVRRSKHGPLRGRSTQSCFIKRQACRQELSNPSEHSCYE
jgi:hypothetical protein